MTPNELEMLQKWGDERHRDTVSRFEKLDRSIERVHDRMDAFESRIDVIEDKQIPIDVAKDTLQRIGRRAIAGIGALFAIAIPAAIGWARGWF